MKLMEGKKGIIFGVSNKRGIAYAIAEQLYEQGAEIAFTYAGEVMKDRVTPLAQEMNSKLIMSCDVTNDEEIKAVFEAYKEIYGKIDFIVHSVAFANRDDLMGDFSSVTREGWDLALGVSAYSLVPMARYGKELFNEGASVFTLSYLGGERSVPNYNIMGVAKAALECTVRYLAAELGPLGVRVNAISAGPLKTLAAKGITGFDALLKVSGVRSPMKRNVTLEEVGKSGLFLASDLSGGITGEVIHVDCGAHSIAASKEDVYILDKMKEEQE